MGLKVVLLHKWLSTTDCVCPHGMWGD